ncbi:glycosyltransferase [Candidatus Roizmanbacteria bacterium]|nr:glycosyltransferase [Candidatus Roizmanbacteria bacterium]
MKKNRLKKSNITFVIFTYNEEKRIAYPIKCYLPYGDVLISDDSSIDNTVKIAEKLGARVIKRGHHGASFVETKAESDFVLSHVKTDWVFWGFADEMVPKTCLNIYKKIAQENKYKVVVQKRKTLMYDGESEFFPAIGSVEIKFYKKGSMDYSNNTIHQSGRFAHHVRPQEILYLSPLDEYSVYHFSPFTTETQIKTISSYYLAHAKTLANNISNLKIVFNPLFLFFTVYILQGAWMRGIKGFIVAMQSMFYTYMISTKAWELKNDITWDSMEKKYRIAKEKMLISSPKSSIFRKVWAYIIMLMVSRLHKWYKFRK